MKRVFAAIVAVAGTTGAVDAGAVTEATVTGLIESEARSNSGGGSRSSEMGVRQAALGAWVNMGENVSAQLSWLYDQSVAEAGRLDVAELRLQMGEGGFVTSGRQYLPFGSFETFMASEPLTLQMAEARGDLFRYGIDAETLQFDLYNFRSPVLVTSASSERFDWGTRLLLRDGEFEFASAYISNLAHAAAFQAAAGGGGLANPVPGYSYAVNWKAETFTFYSEHIFAAEPFASADFGGSAAGAEPEAINYEAGFGLSPTTVLAWTLQKTRGAAFLNLLREYQAIAFTIRIAPEARLTFEWGESIDYQSVTERVSAIELAAEF